VPQNDSMIPSKGTRVYYMLCAHWRCCCLTALGMGGCAIYTYTLLLYGVGVAVSKGVAQTPRRECYVGCNPSTGEGCHKQGT
jgi:hypothetical protein